MMVVVNAQVGPVFVGAGRPFQFSIFSPLDSPLCYLVLGLTSSGASNNNFCKGGLRHVDEAQLLQLLELTTLTLNCRGLGRIYLLISLA